jgi:hypothetical protein
MSVRQIVVVVVVELALLIAFVKGPRWPSAMHWPGWPWSHGDAASDSAPPPELKDAAAVEASEPKKTLPPQDPTIVGDDADAASDFAPSMLAERSGYWLWLSSSIAIPLLVWRWNLYEHDKRRQHHSRPLTDAEVAGAMRGGHGEPAGGAVALASLPEPRTPRMVVTQARIDIEDGMDLPTACLCCERGVPFARPRVCPECDQVFHGQGWDGIDAHWRAHHEVLMPYKEFWTSLCDRHRGANLS